MSEKLDVVVIGAGLTGLSTAHKLHKKGIKYVVLERKPRAGGQIQSYHEGGFTFESGPNTGILSQPEVLELFDDYPDLLQIARPEAKKRLILKQGRFHPLPSGLSSAISTSLFSWGDKLRILLEPWRERGTSPDESVASLVRRRLGESYYRYAVDPFVGGIYAGDPEKLVTRHALPKLYNLERQHGSFVRGAIAFVRRKKTERERRATKEVFSAYGGLSSLTDAISETIEEKLKLGVNVLGIEYLAPYDWLIRYEQQGKCYELRTRHIVTTIGTEELAHMFSSLDVDWLPILAMRYAPIVQVVCGYEHAPDIDFNAFGGLVPSIEDSNVLGILNPSATFSGRTPEGGLLLSLFLGGMRAPEIIDFSDDKINQIVEDRLFSTLSLRQKPDLFRIFRHRRAIPQYEKTTDDRLSKIDELERQFLGLHIGGNMLGGIGMPDRIKQGFDLADCIEDYIKKNY